MGFIETGLPAIVSGATVFLISMYNNKILRENLKKQLAANSLKTYKEIIAAEGIRRINSLRDYIADYISNSYNLITMQSQDLDKPIGEDKATKVAMRELSKSAHLIQLYLDSREERYKVVLNKLSRLQLYENVFFGYDDNHDIEGELNDYDREIHDFCKNCQALLNDELLAIDGIIKPKDRTDNIDRTENLSEGSLKRVGKEIILNK